MQRFLIVNHVKNMTSVISAETPERTLFMFKRLLVAEAVKTLVRRKSSDVVIEMQIPQRKKVGLDEEFSKALDLSTEVREWTSQTNQLVLILEETETTSPPWWRAAKLLYGNHLGPSRGEHVDGDKNKAQNCALKYIGNASLVHVICWKKYLSQIQSSQSDPCKARENTTTKNTTNKTSTILYNLYF